MIESEAYGTLCAVAGPVSRETFQRLRQFQQLVLKWTGRINLVSKSDQIHIWDRHILDSAQLWTLASEPPSRQWVDIGSGGGFPGLVVAILMKEANSGQITLVESNTKKSAFLRQASVEMDLPTTIVSERIEQVIPRIASADIVSARALAPLSDLFELGFPLLSTGSRGLFYKGRDYQREIEDSSAKWSFDVITHASKIDAEGVVLDISNLRRR